jgi:hypothetical protein
MESIDPSTTCLNFGLRGLACWSIAVTLDRRLRTSRRLDEETEWSIGTRPSASGSGRIQRAVVDVGASACLVLCSCHAAVPRNRISRGPRAGVCMKMM